MGFSLKASEEGELNETIQYSILLKYQKGLFGHRRQLKYFPSLSSCLLLQVLACPSKEYKIFTFFLPSSLPEA